MTMIDLEHADHTERALPFALAATCAARHIVQHRVFASIVDLQAHHMRWAGRHTPATAGTAGDVDPWQPHEPRIQPRGQALAMSRQDAGFALAHPVSTRS